MHVSGAELLGEAKVEHRQTTESAQRALKVAVETTEIARTTIAELHRQGRQLDLASTSVFQVQDEVKEARSLVRFMKRLCCFAVATSCCSSCSCVDSNVHRDATRATRVQQSQQQRHNSACNAAQQCANKQRQTGAMVSKKHGGHTDSKEAQERHDLFGGCTTIPAQRRGAATESWIGHGLSEEEQEQLQIETRAQERCLDNIGIAVDSMNTISKAMQDELAKQLPQIESLHVRVACAHDDLRTVTRDTAHMTGRRPAEGKAER